ncbi:MAG: recombinase family protein [Gammaproteobacteria bacterium]
MIRTRPATPAATSRQRCAIYTRKSSEEGMEQDTNSLDAQRGACEAYVTSQAHEGWRLLPTRFDDGGFSGGTLERPALQALMEAIKARKVDVVVIYKIDRLSRSLMDFVQLAENFDAHQVSFLLVTHAFSTTSSMGRLILNVLLSFAQFEREVTGTRRRQRSDGRTTGGGPFSRGHLYRILNNLLYIGCIPHKGQSYPGSHPGLVDEPTFAAAQAGLAGNTHLHRTRRNHRAATLLAGLLVDAEGKRFRATHVVKKGRRYRYYNHPALVTGDPSADLPLRRVPATDVEKAVLEALARLRTNAESTVGGLGEENVAMSAHQLERAGLALNDKLAADSPLRIETIQQLVPRIVLTTDSLRLQIDRSALRAGLGVATAATFESSDTHEVLVPTAIRSRQGLERLIFEPPHQRRQPRLDRTLIRTVAQAHRWWGQIESGQYRSVKALAAAEGLSNSYVTRVLRLAFLAPELVADIVIGEQPTEVSARRLVNHPGLPFDGEAQRQKFRVRYQ